MAIQVKIKNQAEDVTKITLDKDTPHIQLLTRDKYVSENIAIELEGADLSDATAAAADLLSGKIAYTSGGEKITGTITSLAAATYNTSTTDLTIASGKYLSGDQIIKAVTTSGIEAANIRANTVVKVGDANDDNRIISVTGTYTSDADAVAANILASKTAYVNGEKITGSMAEWDGSMGITGPWDTNPVTATLASEEYTWYRA